MTELQASFDFNLRLVDPISPFDAIMLDGEVWSARDLMPMLGYVEWRKFEGAIERAKATAANSGAGQGHFVGAAKVIAGGRWGQSTVGDYHLTRYAAYLVAMNGDPRKAEVAAAQTYFAVKTREAETAQPAIPTHPEALRGWAAELELRQALEAKVTADAPKVEAYDTLMDADGKYSVGTTAKILGVGQNTLFRKLRNAEIFISKGPMYNTPYQKYMHHFEVKAGTRQRSNGDAETVYTTYVQPSGIQFISSQLELGIRSP